jgi:hypothetical protein
VDQQVGIAAIASQQFLALTFGPNETRPHSGMQQDTMGRRRKPVGRPYRRTLCGKRRVSALFD